MNHDNGNDEAEPSQAQLRSRAHMGVELHVTANITITVIILAGLAVLVYALMAIMR